MSIDNPYQPPTSAPTKMVPTFRLDQLDERIVQFQGVVDLKDYKLLARWPRIVPFFRVVTYTALALAVVQVVMYCIAYYRGTPNPGPTVGWFVLTMVCFAVLMLCLFFATGYASRQVFQGPAKNYLGEISGSISPDRLTVVSTTAQVQVPWHLMGSVQLRKRVILIVLSFGGNENVLLQSKHFANDDEWNWVREALTQFTRFRRSVSNQTKAMSLTTSPPTDPLETPAGAIGYGGKPKISELFYNNFFFKTQGVAIGVLLLLAAIFFFSGAKAPVGAFIGMFANVFFMTSFVFIISLFTRPYIHGYVDQDGVTLGKQDATYRYSWAAFKKIRTSKRSAQLTLQGVGMPFQITRSLFSDEGQWLAACELMEQFKSNGR